jgi:hypothetical protein
MSYYRKETTMKTKPSSPAELWIEDGKLKVRGYLGPFYKTQMWKEAVEKVKGGAK